LSAAAQVKWTGVSDAAGVGQFASISGAGDVNNDGFADLLIGANTESGAARNAGAAYIILGSSAPGSGTVSLATADAIFTGALENDRAGDSLGPAGDVNDDGFADIIIGAGYSSYDSDQGGSVYVITGPVSGTVDLQQSFFHTWVSEDGARASGRGVGDLDNDGLSDVMMGAWRASSQTGELHLFFSDGL
ncbi:MAG: integrin alpha, partial [Myxococcota bacterium]|nr:integrin alpha [Myxococcota bacterium]